MGEAVLGAHQWSWEMSSHGPGGKDAHRVCCFLELSLSLLPLPEAGIEQGWG